VLDTNVISVLVSATPHPNDQVVIDWVGTLPPRDFWLASPSWAEIAYGIALLPEGRRQTQLRAAVDAFFKVMESRIISFDAAAAQVYGEIMAARRRSGQPMAVIDAQIAACTRTVKATLATRNRRDFEDAGLRLVDPWDRSTW
jgi:predicted nucleic acid-binding protein